jgi:hypothetical protein
MGGGPGLCAEGEQARVGEAQERHQACGWEPLGGPGCGWERAVRTGGPLGEPSRRGRPGGPALPGLGLLRMVRSGTP